MAVQVELDNFSSAENITKIVQKVAKALNLQNQNEEKLTDLAVTVSAVVAAIQPLMEAVITRAKTEKVD